MSTSRPPLLQTNERRSQALPQTEFPPQSTFRRTPRNLFLDLPIAWRLTSGFLIAALIAALAAGIVGVQRSQSLSKQTTFYQNLLQSNTSLTNGRNFLELMNSEVRQTLVDASVAHPSRETLADDTSAITNLTALYAQILNSYAQNRLVEQHPDQLALLAEAGESGLADQQHTLGDSAQRTWQVYQKAQKQILADISSGNLPGAQNTWQEQGQPTNDDALSALQSLIQLDDRLASAVDNATNVEIHNQLITMLVAIICAFIAIALVGWFISETLVRRLRDLHHVTRAVEEGRMNERIQVAGRDEIANVSIAVNGMLDTIVGLLEETRQQRDALSGAAEHLFSDMRIVNAGDLRVNATVSNDPIGMLANAFNFTVGRFRRFILRTQTSMEQLDVISHQSLERSNTFLSLVRAHLKEGSTPRPPQSHPGSAMPPVKNPFSTTGTSSLPPSLRKSHLQHASSSENSQLTRQVQQTKDELIHVTRDDLGKRLGTTREAIERASLSVGRLSELISSRTGSYSGNVTEKMTQAQLQELVTLQKLLGRLAQEVQQAQFASTTHFARIDTAFGHLARLVAEQPVIASEVLDAASIQDDPQFQEMVRQAGSFGVEVNALSRRLATIIQEMRSSVTPFRLEGTTNISDLTRSFSSQPAAEHPSRQTSSGNLISSQ